MSENDCLSTPISEQRPKTLKNLKRLATRIKKQQGFTHTQALEIAAKQAGFDSYIQAKRALPERGLPES